MSESNKVPQFLYGLGASLGAFLTGCCIGITSPQDDAIKDNPTYSNNSWNVDDWWVRASFPLSAFAFCKLAALDIEKRGRMRTLKISAIVFFLMVLLYASFFWNKEKREHIELILVFSFRAVLGMGCSLASTAVPIYFGEIAQKEIRGAIGSLFYLQLTLGVLAAYCLLVFGCFMSISVFGATISFIFLCAVHLKPESPLYLMKMGDEEAANASLTELRGKDYDVRNELDTMRAMAKKSKESNITLLQQFTYPPNMRALLICVGLMFLQQFSGIHPVLLATASSFKETLSNFDHRYSFVFVGAVQAFGAIIAMILVDLAGRRLLLFISAASMTVLMLALAVCHSIKETGWTPLVLQFSFVLMFSLGCGPIPWIMLSEVFPFSTKDKTAFLAVSSFWLFHYINTELYIMLRSKIGTNHSGYLLWIFFSILLLSILFAFFFVPETKQKSLPEIEEMLI